MKIIIVGAGQVGTFLCERLATEGHEVILIEHNEEFLQRAQDRLDVMGIAGNGASAETLEQAGIKEAKIFIAVTDFDEVNILACLLAREYNVETRIARVKSIEYSGRSAVLSKEKLGIDLLINPDEEVAKEIVKIACRTGAFDVAEFVEGQIQFLGYRIDERSPLCDLTLRELGDLHGMYRFIITAITRNNKTIIPRGEDTIRAGDSIFIFVHYKDLPAIQYMVQPGRNRKFHRPRAFVFGGGRVGLSITQQLEKSHFDVRLIEENDKRCRRLAGQLQRALVIQSEPTDLQNMLEEGIAGAEISIAVTDNDETNILASLLAKKHGAKRCLSLINKPELLELAPTLGVDACVSPRQAAAAAILKYVRRGGVIHLTTIEGSNAEVLEIEIPGHSRIIGKPLHKLNFPANAIVATVVQGQRYEIASGETIFRAGDRVVVFALPEAVARVEKFFG